MTRAAIYSLFLAAFAMTAIAHAALSPVAHLAG